MLRFVLVTTAHAGIKYFSKMKTKYLKNIRKLERNPANGDDCENPS